MTVCTALYVESAGGLDLVCFLTVRLGPAGLPGDLGRGPTPSILTACSENHWPRIGPTSCEGWLALQLDL